MLQRINMNVGLLLVFSLITGSALRSWTGCQGGWVELSCTNPKISLPTNRSKMTQTVGNKFTFVVKNLQQDYNVTNCTGRGRTGTIKIMNCAHPLNSTIFNKEQTTIACGNPFSTAKSPQTFLCKETGDFDCEDVLTINTHANYSRNTSGLYVNISEVNPEDEGLYWCVAKTTYIWTYKKVFLTVHSDRADSYPENFQEVTYAMISLNVSVILVVLAIAIVILILFKRRKNTSENNQQEEIVYEEIQDPATGRGVTTIYSTVEACKESDRYATLDFGNSPISMESKASGSRCEYNAVFIKRKDKCTIASAASEEPLYSNLKPQ